MWKIFISMVGLIFTSSLLFAQNNQGAVAKEPATKLESFLGNKGKILVKDFYKLGETVGRYGSKIKIDVLVIYEPGQEMGKVRGLKIEVAEEGSISQSNTAFLDMEEVESLSQALAYMLDLSGKWKAENREYTEVVFTTKGDFNIGFWQTGVEQGAFASSGYIGKTTCIFSSTQDLSHVKSLVDKGFTLLKEK